MPDGLMPRPPLPGAPPQERWLHVTLFGVVGTIGVLAAGLVGYVITDAAMPTRAQMQACDRVVETLLTTRDPIELQRAAALVSALRCDVVRRMPPTAAVGS